MLKWKLIFAIIFLWFSFPNFETGDFYSKFFQKDYEVDFQRLELEDYNKSILNFIHVITTKYNRTLPVVNATFNSKKNMSTGVEMETQMFKFLSNEYRIMPGSRFQLNLCKAIKENIVGFQNLFKCGNFVKCEIIQERTYEICNAYPDETRFPPYLPNGEFKFRVKITNDDVFVYTTSLYVKIYRPVAIPKSP